MTLTRQALRCVLCLLIAITITSCKEEAPTTQAPIAHPEPELLMVLPDPVSVVPVASTPTVAIYPLIPAPGTVGVSADALLVQLEHELTTGLGYSDELVVLDRSDTNGNVLSPERKVLAIKPAADYVLTGVLTQQSDHTSVRLQLSHVASHRLVAVEDFMLDVTYSLNNADITRFLSTAIKKDREKANSATTFRLSVAGILPTVDSMHQSAVARKIQAGVTTNLLQLDDYTMVSGDMAHGLYLESARSPQTSGIERADIIVYARLLDAESDDDGFDLVLFLERVDGLRKVIALHEQTVDALAKTIVASVQQHLKPVSVVSMQNRQAAQQIVDQAWAEIFRNGQLSVNHFPRKLTDRNTPKLASFSALLDKAMELDPTNPEAIAGKALLGAPLGDHANSYTMLHALLWDPRPYAFDLGVQILKKKLNMGSSLHHDGNLAGLPGYGAESEAVEELVRHKMLIDRNNDGQYWWSYGYRQTPMAMTDEEMWEYVLGVRNPELDSLARFKLQRGSITTHHPSRKNNVHTGIDYRQSLYYALANTVAPLYLDVGKSGYYSTPVELQSGLNDSFQLTQEQLFSFQRLAGMAALSQTPAIEPDVLFAAALCRYRQSLCASSRQLYESITYRSGRFRAQVVDRAHNAERTTLYADSLIAMARSKVRELGKQSTSTQQATLSTTNSAPVAETQRVLLEDVAAIKQIDNAIEPCSHCAGLKSLRGVSASPSGRWLADSESYYGVPGRYTASTELKTWMFDQG